MRPSRPAVLIAILTLLAVRTGHANDWPQYRGPLGNGTSDESIPDSFQLRTLWKSETPLGFSSFAVKGDRLFTIIADGEAGQEICVAMDAKSGQENWRQPLGSNDYGRGGGDAGAPGNRGGDGPRSTPTVDAEHVYVYDSHLVLSCFRSADGAMIWQRDIAKEFGGENIKWKNASSPLLIGNRIFVSGGGQGQTFLAFDKQTGKNLWKRGDETMTHATPVLYELHGKPQVIFFMESGLVSLDPSDGDELWRQKFRFSVSTAASPVAAGERVYCSAGYGVGAGLFQVSSSFEPSKVWLKPNKLMNHWSTPVERDGFLYGIFEFKKYGKAPLQCVDLTDGEIRWSERGFGPGNCILAGDKLVVLSDAGDLVIAKASPDGYEELARESVLDGKCWSTPALSNGHIYIRSTQEAACLAISPSR